ncbi:ABC transporter permease [Paenibacillus sp. UMB4589-SE434]|uniref:ABC transporter permease n=1 Tax=Paenibacillus sp. UMB4589-SE434 TaxID=3046314 RepID=UPI00254B7BD0|nr:ABC transporter permease [Paenibacillus sp. UMB4589-SE434]MDK8182840.1 ABC transporter permease [Paenibacillus sp. UMB4589-SE434]
MRTTQALKMAWRSILSNKLRTLLTMLGIMIGVAAVITLVSMGEGTAKQVKSQVASLGSNLLSVTVTGRGALSSLTLDEAMSFQTIPGVAAVSPVVSGNVQAKAGLQNTNVPVEGITAEYETVRDYHVSSGRFILPIDATYYQKVAIIGTDTAAELYPEMNPLGQNLSLNGAAYKIVGVMESKGSSLGSSNDNKVWIPLTTAERLLQSKGIRTVYVKFTEPEQADTITTVLESKLTSKFRGSTDSYRIFNQADMVETISNVSQTMTLMLAGIASISLLVGGIGIMNIMLVSVTERTREIGIRKSLGAKKRDIMQQFMMEAAMISGCSGLCGIAIGIAGAYFASRAMGTPFALAPDMMWLAFSFSVGIGVVFGLFPANKASNLKPVDALRYD